MDSLPPEIIPALAALYDRFANAINLGEPDQARDQAEQTFGNELSRWYDELGPEKPEFRVFKRAAISRCKAHLKAPQNP
jgi:hypothetical protein